MPATLRCAAVLLVVLATGVPAEAKIEVHFASVFNANGDKLNGVWLIGVNCGDGTLTKGLGVCADAAEACVATAVAQCPKQPTTGGVVAPHTASNVIMNDNLPMAAVFKGPIRYIGTATPSTTTESPGQWTAWLNRDTPGGSGDFESLTEFVKTKAVCALPVAIECRTRDGRDWRETGQNYKCEPSVGGVCRNAEQKNGRCLDYEVRFQCVTGPQFALTCNDDQSTCTCDTPQSCAVLKSICSGYESRKGGTVLVGSDCLGASSAATQ